MFQSAKDHGADAISLSWTFATADLASARFIGAFLEREITSAGIVIGFAAGNGGPGAGSANIDDYIPHDGYGVGAFISEAQAHNVYGWSGDVADGVIHYSSFGPTAGGRQIPDVVSPLMTLVRGARGNDGDQFYGFGGTSSATPALVGSITALVSALKDAGVAAIDARLLKLAIVQSAKALADTPASRQGAGLIDVNGAYDVYLRLAGELAAAQADPAHRTPFAYELKVETDGDGAVSKVEGLALHRYVDTARIDVKLADASLALIDPLTFIDALQVRHRGTFFATQSVATLQGGGATLTLSFSAAELATPGVYDDVIELVHPSDGLVLARIPVVVEIPAHADQEGLLAQLSGPLAPLAIWRQPVALDAPSVVNFDGVAIDRGGNAGASVSVAIRNDAGGYVSFERQTLAGAATPLTFASALLPAGHSELLVFRTFSTEASLGALDVHGAFSLPAADLVGATADGAELDLALKARRGFTYLTAHVTVTGTTQTVTLTRDDAAARPGYYGHVTLPEATSSALVGLRQTSVDAALEGLRNLEVSFVDATSRDVPFRGWIDLSSTYAAPRGAVDLLDTQLDYDVVAYPNLVDWASLQTRRLLLDVETPLAAPLTAATAPAGRAVGRGAVFPVHVTLPSNLPAGAVGQVEIKGATGTVLATVPFQL
jgi:hypothetical protein